MRKSRFTEEQFIWALKQAGAGVKIAGFCRQMGVSEATSHRWRGKYGGVEAGDAKRLRQLEAVNGRLKKLVAEPTLDAEMLKDVLERRW